MSLPRWSSPSSPSRHKPSIPSPQLLYRLSTLQWSSHLTHIFLRLINPAATFKAFQSHPRTSRRSDRKKREELKDHGAEQMSSPRSSNMRSLRLRGISENFDTGGTLSPVANDQINIPMQEPLQKVEPVIPVEPTLYEVFTHIRNLTIPTIFTLLHIFAIYIIILIFYMLIIRDFSYQNTPTSITPYSSAQCFTFQLQNLIRLTYNGHKIRHTSTCDAYTINSVVPTHTSQRFLRVHPPNLNTTLCANATIACSTSMVFVTYATRCSAALTRLATELNEKGIGMRILGMGKGWRGPGHRIRVIHDYVATLENSTLVVVSIAPEQTRVQCDAGGVVGKWRTRRVLAPVIVNYVTALKIARREDTALFVGRANDMARTFRGLYEGECHEPDVTEVVGRRNIIWKGVGDAVEKAKKAMRVLKEEGEDVLRVKAKRGDVVRGMRNNTDSARPNVLEHNKEALREELERFGAAMEMVEKGGWRWAVRGDDSGLREVGVDVDMRESIVGTRISRVGKDGIRESGVVKKEQPCIWLDVEEEKSL